MNKRYLFTLIVVFIIAIVMSSWWTLKKAESQRKLAELNTVVVGKTDDGFHKTQFDDWLVEFKRLNPKIVIPPVTLKCPKKDIRPLRGEGAVYDDENSCFRKLEVFYD